jgi:hypothetical protein
VPLSIAVEPEGEHDFRKPNVHRELKIKLRNSMQT